MRAFQISKDFKRDLKKLPAEIMLSSEFIEVFYCLQHDLPLPEKYKDHPLTGDWRGYRDCHIKNDLVLIYKIEGDLIKFARVNSHSEVF